MNKQFDELLQKRMDRKDFLKHVGMGVAIITGTAGIVKLLGNGSRPAGKVGQKQQPVNMGYGASAYGGHPTGTAKL